MFFAFALVSGATGYMGKGGKGGKGNKQPSSSKGSGWHIQHEPRNKFDPEWKPRRGGKKAKRQQQLFQRKYSEWLASQGVPEPAENLEVGSDSSGFPDFPGSLERLAEVEVQELVDVIIEENPQVTPHPIAAAPVTPPKALVPVPRFTSEVIPVPVKRPRTQAPEVAAASNPYSAAPPKVATPFAKVPTPLAEVPVVPKVPVPTAKPPAVIAKDPAVAKVPSKTRPLSGPTIDLTRSDPTTSIPRVLEALGNREVRVSLDYNGTSNVEYPGARQGDRIYQSVVEAICEFLLNSPQHKIGFKSYIGLHGNRSQQRCSSLKAQVVFLNRFLKSRGIPESQFVGLDITTSRTKEDLHSGIAHCHVDDKWETIDRVVANGVDGVLFYSRSYPGYNTVSSISEFLTQAQNRCVPRVFREPFYAVPVPPSGFVGSAADR